MHLNGATFSDSDFFQLQREADRGWLRPLGLALAVHLAVFGLAVVMPEMMRHKPLLDEVVTVNLVSMPEITPQEAPPAAKKPPEPPKAQPVEKIEPAQAKIRIPQAVPLKPAETAVPAKPVSLKPIRRKVEMVDRKKLAREQARRRQEQERLKAVARARAEEQKAREEAEQARAALADLIREQGARQAPAASSGSSGRQEVQSIVLKQYLSLLFGKVQQLWVLPDIRQWSPNLETVVVLTILRDGTVTKTVIERKSSDPFFDQFVMKTIESAKPMPPFPKLMPQNSIEVGLRFRPGQLLTE